jgi:hypothetical protein
MNIFNGKLDITSVLPKEGTTDQWDIVALFTDVTGIFYAVDAIPGDVIFIDGTPYNLGILRYRISAIDTAQTDLYNLYVTIQWDSYSEVSEPYSGFESCIGRSVFGSVYIPSASIQNISPSFLDYIRNSEHSRGSQASLVNRTYNGAYLGDRDGFNQVFQVVDPFILETLDVYVNGIRLTPGDINTDPNDYVLISGSEIQLTISPKDYDILTFNYNKK